MMPKIPKRLLAIGLNYLGDALFTTPALATLRNRFPHAQIDLLLGERALSILEGATGADRLIPRSAHGSFARVLSLSETLRQGQYDAVILFQSILSSAMLTWAARVPVRVGFAQASCAPFLTHPIAPRFPREHVVDAYLRLAQAVGSEFPGTSASPENGLIPPRLRIALSGDDTAFADRFLRDHEIMPPIVGLVIGATRAQKRWPEGYFARLAERLWQSSGAACVLLGGREEQEVSRRILQQSQVPLISAVGDTTAKQLAALIARLSVVVSGDSGPLHIATAMGTPVVALFGSTSPDETGPWTKQPNRRNCKPIVLYDNLSCAPCRKSPTCGGRFDCMHALTPERVLDAVLMQLPDDEKVSVRRSVLPMVTTTSTTAAAGAVSATVVIAREVAG